MSRASPWPESILTSDKETSNLKFQYQSLPPRHDRPLEKRKSQADVSAAGDKGFGGNYSFGFYGCRAITFGNQTDFGHRRGITEKNRGSAGGQPKAGGKDYPVDNGPKKFGHLCQPAGRLRGGGAGWSRPGVLSQTGRGVSA